MKNNTCMIFIIAFYLSLPFLLWYIFSPYWYNNYNNDAEYKQKEFMQNVKKVSQDVWNDGKI